MESVCEQASKEKMGARPLKRLISEFISDEIINFYFKSDSIDPVTFDFKLSNSKVTYDIVN
jgi:ATP-dependent Clp protease ATP-binding subunit ClpA